MAETETKPELSMEVLAPSDNIREDLVATAVKFLQNPKVHQSPLSQKKAFLQRKGLTAEEIDVAVGRAGVKSGSEPAISSQMSGQLAPSPVIPATAPYVSNWVKARDMMAVITMVTGLSYAAYKLYKELIAPWLFGIQTREQRMAQLEQTVADSMASVNKTLASIEETLGKQQEKLQILSHDVNSKTGGSSIDTLENTTRITEIKTELSSIKGLLLNRRQFPPVPTTMPSLPSWQLATNSGDADSNNKGDKKETTEITNTITYSPTSALDTSVQTSDKNIDNNSSTNVAAQKTLNAAENKNDLDTDTVQNEAVNIQNEAVGQSSDTKITEDADDSEENES